MGSELEESKDREGRLRGGLQMNNRRERVIRVKCCGSRKSTHSMEKELKNGSDGCWKREKREMSESVVVGVLEMWIGIGVRSLGWFWFRAVWLRLLLVVNCGCGAGSQSEKEGPVGEAEFSTEQGQLARGQQTAFWHQTFWVWVDGPADRADFSILMPFMIPLTSVL